MLSIDPLDDVPPSWLLVSTARNGTPVYEAGWRHREPDGSLRTMKRRLGPAWLEPAADGTFTRRRGRVRSGFLDEHAAIVAKDRVVREVERALAERADAAWREANAPPTFRVIAHAYLDWLEQVRGAKPATLREHRYLLIEPGTPHRRGRGEHRGLIMDALGDRPADEVTTREINAMLTEQAASGVAPRTVNKTRQLVGAIFNYACHESTFGLTRNPATASDRRPEPERARLDFYSPEEVEALARAVAAGQHRDPHAPAVSDEEAEARSSRTAKTPKSSASRPTRAFAAGNSSRCDGATSTSPATRSSCNDPSAPTSRRRRPSHGAPARSHCLTRRPGRSTGSRSAATSRAPTITCSSTVSAGGSTGQHCGAASSERATAPGFRHCASTTCAIRTGRCSSPVVSTSRRSRRPWATRGSRPPSATSTRDRRARWPGGSHAPSRRLNRRRSLPRSARLDPGVPQGDVSHRPRDLNG